MKKWTTIIVILILIGASAGGIVAAREFYFKEDTDKEADIIDEGDSVTLHYTGWLQDDRIYDEDINGGWRIFDTSRTNLSGPKTVTFSDRPRGNPFTFTVGEGEVIQGWDEGVRGLKEGETKVFFVRPEKGYQGRTDELKYTVEKEETLPVYEEMTQNEFQNRHNTAPSPGMVVEDIFWSWDQKVTSVEGDIVHLRNNPTEGGYYHTYQESGDGWLSKVISYDSNADQGEGEITVRHLVDEKTVVDANHIDLHNESYRDVKSIRRENEQSARTKGIVVDTGDEITIDFNDEVYGRRLRFQVKIKDIQ